MRKKSVGSISALLFAGCAAGSVPPPGTDQPTSLANDLPIHNNCNRGAGKCLQETYVSYYDRAYLDPVEGYTEHAWPRVIKDLPSLAVERTMIPTDFATIHDRLHATGVRLLAAVDPGWSTPSGFTFPQPTDQELANFNAILDMAVAADLDIFIVALFPKQYRDHQPTDRDDFYAKNNQYLIDNVNDYYRRLLPGIYQAHARHIKHVSMGEFDPIGVYGQTPGDPTWIITLWPEFHRGYGVVPAAKTSFELEGDTRAPTDATTAGAAKKGDADEVRWVRQALTSRGLSEPARYSIEVYTADAWQLGYKARYLAFQHLFTQLVQAVDGDANRIMFEEIGASQCASDDTSDGAAGEHVFSAAFSQMFALDPTIPVGVWQFGNSKGCSTNGMKGLFDENGQPTAGEWVIPDYFAN
jgi:hypothetical protein